MEQDQLQSAPIAEPYDKFAELTHAMDWPLAGLGHPAGGQRAVDLGPDPAGYLAHAGDRSGPAGTSWSSTASGTPWLGHERGHVPPLPVRPDAERRVPRGVRQRRPRPQYGTAFPGTAFTDTLDLSVCAVAWHDDRH
ncbi:hypothetical protein GCM10029964_015620 [Kibdelosporangium lantanae]